MQIPIADLTEFFMLLLPFDHCLEVRPLVGLLSKISLSLSLSLKIFPVMHEVTCLEHQDQFFTFSS